MWTWRRPLRLSRNQGKVTEPQRVKDTVYGTYDLQAGYSMNKAKGTGRLSSLVTTVNKDKPTKKLKIPLTLGKEQWSTASRGRGTPSQRNLLPRDRERRLLTRQVIFPALNL
jgi:hypothetical protein